MDKMITLSNLKQYDEEYVKPIERKDKDQDLAILNLKHLIYETTVDHVEATIENASRDPIPDFVDQHKVIDGGEIMLSEVIGKTNKDMFLTSRAGALGNTMKWNQLVINGNFINGDYWSPYFAGGTNILEVSNNRLKYTTRYTYSDGSIIQNNIKFKSYHKYFLRYFIELDKQKRIYSLLADSTNIGNPVLVLENTRTPIESIMSTGNVGENAERFRIGLISSDEAETVTGYIDSVMVSDLTDIFGAGNEPTSTADPRVQFLIQHAKDHPEYDSGSIKSAVVSKQEFVGENIIQYNRNYQDININGAIITFNLEKQTFSFNGTASSSGGRLFYFFKMKLKAGTYYFGADVTGSILNMCLTNVSNSQVVMIGAGSFTLDSEVELGLGFNTSTNLSYSGTARIYLIKGAEAKPYTPYISQTIAFSEPQTLNGLDSVRDETFSYVEGNELVTKKIVRYGSIDLGTLNWTHTDANTYGYWFTYQLDGQIKLPPDNYTPSNLLVSNDNPELVGGFEVSGISNAIAVNTGGTLVYCNGSATAQPSGILVYELAQPTITEISRVPLTCDFEHIEHVITDSDLGEENIEKGALKTPAVTDFKVHGANIWDEEWELAYGSRVSPKNAIKVKPNTKYYFFTDGKYIAELDSCNEDLSNKQAINFNIVNGVVTIPDGVEYIWFYMNAEYGTTYNHDIAIIQGTSGTYKPYKAPLVLNFPQSVELNGVGTAHDKLIIEQQPDLTFDLIKETAIGKVDLETLRWSRTKAWYTRFDEAKPAAYGSEPLALSSKYVTSNTASVWDSTSFNNHFTITNSIGEPYPSIIVNNGSTTERPSGILVYELANPTRQTLITGLTETQVATLLEKGGTIEVGNESLALPDVKVWLEVRKLEA